MQLKQENNKDLHGDDRIKLIGEVLGLLEETNKSKDWILAEMRKQDLNFPIESSMNNYDLLSCCTSDFIESLLHILKGDDIISPEGVETKVYHWFFSDIVAGSNPNIPTKAQVSKIVVLNELISRTQAFKERDPLLTIILPTGDGMAIGFGDSPEKPFLLSIELHKALLQYNESKRGKDKLLLRIGLESGPVFFVKDLEGKDNVWGPGIILTRRVMDLCGDMQIFIASRIAEELVRISPKYKEMLHFVQNYETKYGEKIQLFNVYGDGFGNKTAPTKPKKSATVERTAKVASNFSFNEIDVLLDISDTKTMKTHHTWIWDMVNVSKEPKSRIFYFLDGQVPRDFGELRLKVTDQDDNRLEIGEITVNKPYRKEFYVIPDKPVMPKQRIMLKLQYEWEEPERVFSYKFPSGAKKFSYVCSLPKEIDLKNMILKVDLGTGYKIHATPPATIKRLNDRTVVTWGKSNILPQDAYKFQW